MKPPVRYGLILGGIMIALPLLFYGIGMEKDDSMQKVSSVLNFVVTAVVIFLGIRDQRDKIGGGFISFGSGFSSGMKISLIGGAISAVFSYIYFTMINPGMITYIRMKQEEELVKQGYSDETIEKMAHTMEAWTSPGVMCLFVILGMLLIGLVISLICAAILKKENPAAQIS